MASCPGDACRATAKTCDGSPHLGVWYIPAVTLSELELVIGAVGLPGVLWLLGLVLPCFVAPAGTEREAKAADDRATRVRLVLASHGSAQVRATLVPQSAVLGLTIFAGAALLPGARSVPPAMLVFFVLLYVVLIGLAVGCARPASSAASHRAVARVFAAFKIPVPKPYEQPQPGSPWARLWGSVGRWTLCGTLAVFSIAASLIFLAYVTR